LTIHHDDRGFTLVEVTIILLVLVLLSTIMLPQLGNYNRLARFVKLHEDLGALCAEMKKMLDESMENAFWGNPQSRTLPIGFLYGPGDTPAIGSISPSGYANGNWPVDGPRSLYVDVLTDVAPDQSLTTYTDSFDNHLQRNTPYATSSTGVGVGGLGEHYDTNADFGAPFDKEWWAMGWSGPYFNKIEPDPWGNRYASNVFGLHSTPNGDYFLGAVVVISAGPNERIETNFDLYPSHITKCGNPGPGYVIGGDDATCVLSAGGPM
jgi:type II secretory pathway pseudopilin PulG